MRSVTAAVRRNSRGLVAADSRFADACHSWGGSHWSHGGPTDLDNLILLCGFHHRFVHEHGWHITTNENNQFQFRKSDWILYPKPKPDLHPRLAALVGTRST